jgi:hypothetical protein
MERSDKAGEGPRSRIIGAGGPLRKAWRAYLDDTILDEAIVVYTQNT